MFDTTKQNRMEIALAILRITEAPDKPVRPWDIQTHAFADFFLQWRLPKPWTLGKILSIAEWLQDTFDKQLKEANVADLIIDKDVAAGFADSLDKKFGDEIVDRVFAFCGMHPILRGHKYEGSASSLGTVQGVIPTYPQ